MSAEEPTVKDKTTDPSQTLPLSSQHRPEQQKGEYLGDVLNRALARRTFLKGAGAASAVLLITPTLVKPTRALAGAGDSDTSFRDPGDRLTFETVPAGREADIVVPPGYAYHVIVRWGDALTTSAPAFDLLNQNGASQAQQFGFNCDLVLWFALPRWLHKKVSDRGHLDASTDTLLGRRLQRMQTSPSKRALLAVNHEYTTGADMFPNYDPNDPTQDQCEAEIEAHGVSIVEIEFDSKDAKWCFVPDSPFNRRTTGSTPMEITGPLRGHELMKTSDDPEGISVKGSLNNCAGGRTPWGTVLSCEENFDQYFANFDKAADSRSKQLSLRLPAEGAETERKWERYDKRFDVSEEPNEYNRFGYVIEIDPYDPTATPKKRTALGRFKHEGAATAVTRDGRVAVYSGDDAIFEYVYKFVTQGVFDPLTRNANRTLLDEGTLYVARFDVGEVAGDEMGTGAWLPLVWEEGDVLHKAGFENQQEVLLNTRGAADALGATPMDRPEDIEASPKDGRVYVTLTNNSARTVPDEANPRAPNPHGHIIELIEDNDDAGSMTFRWNIFVKCGDPKQEHGTRFGAIADPAAEGVSPISDPDNIVFDDDGNLWISTDGQAFSGDVGFGQNDAVFAVPVAGEQRGLLRQFLSAVPGAEVCGPEFSGDNRTFFCAIQHPHDGEAFTANKHWPADEHDVSKPSVIGVQQLEGRKIGR